MGVCVSVGVWVCVTSPLDHSRCGFTFLGIVDGIDDLSHVILQRRSPVLNIANLLDRGANLVESKQPTQRGGRGGGKEQPVVIRQASCVQQQQQQKK